MHMRFDGHLGFAGGKIDENLFGSSVEDAKLKVTENLIRELKEELNLDLEKHKITNDNCICTHRRINRRKGRPPGTQFLHFYAYQVFIQIFEFLY